MVDLSLIKDLDRYIRAIEKSINFQIKDSGLTKEQLTQGGNLNYLYNKYFRFPNRPKGDDDKAKMVFWDLTRFFLEYDFKTAISINKQKEALQVLKETKDDGGFVLLERYSTSPVTDGQTYYAFTSNSQGEISVYTWDDGDEFITDGGLELIPDEILEKENVQDLINSLKKKEDEV